MWFCSAKHFVVADSYFVPLSQNLNKVYAA